MQVRFFFSLHDPIMIQKIFKYNFPLNYPCFYEFLLTSLKIFFKQINSNQTILDTLKLLIFKKKFENQKLI